MKIKKASLTTITVGISLLALLISVTTATNDNSVFSQSPKSSNNQTTMIMEDVITRAQLNNASEGLSYDTENMTHRSAIQ